MSADAHNIKDEVRKYLIVFAALLILTVVTVAISYLHLSTTMAIVLALIVATFKASLVVLFFMHLISERRVIYMFLSFTVIFFLGVLILPYLEHHSVPEGTEHTNHRFAVEQPVAHHETGAEASEHGGGHH
jgi:cytochrome c oxidase subunit 4